LLVHGNRFFIAGIVGYVYFWREGKARNKQNDSTPSYKNIPLADAVSEVAE